MGSTETLAIPISFSLGQIENYDLMLLSDFALCSKILSFLFILNYEYTGMQ